MAENAKSLQEILKGIEKSYGKGITTIGVGDRPARETFSLGTPGFDFCTYNSIPQGVFIELLGPEQSGKTTCAFLMAADYIRKEKKKPIESRRKILFVDAEGTADSQWALNSTGYDMNDEDIQTIYLTPLGQSAEQIFDMVIDLVKTGEIGLVIFDSLVAIAPQQINEESMEKKDMGGLASVLKYFVTKATGVFNRYRTTFIGINGTTMNLSPYGNPETSPGGTYWKRACSLRLKFKRGEFFDEDGNTLKGSAESPAGHVIEMAVLKTKFCRWDRKLGRCHLNYTKGIDVLQDTIELACRSDFDIIREPSKGWFVVVDPDTGEALTDKIHGINNVAPFFKEHVDVWRKVYDKVYEKLSTKDDPNIVSFEKMLGINVGESFNVDFVKEGEEQ